MHLIFVKTINGTMAKIDEKQHITLNHHGNNIYFACQTWQAIGKVDFQTAMNQAEQAIACNSPQFKAKAKGFEDHNIYDWLYIDA